jgi:hypothetical protein
MKRRRSLYARPVIVRGEQCAEARPGARCDTEQLPGPCGGHGRAGSLAIAERSLVIQPQAPAPQEGVRRAAGRLPGCDYRRMSECCRADRPSPVRVPSGSAIACPKEVHVSAQTRPGMRCPEACPRDVRLDAGHGTADIERGPGLRTSAIAWMHVVMTSGSQCAGSGLELAKGHYAHCPPVLSGHARMSRPRAWSAATRMVGRSALEVSASGRSQAGRVRAYWPGGHIGLGRPADRTVGGFRHVRRPASHCRVSAREPIGGDGGRAGVR